MCAHKRQKEEKEKEPWGVVTLQFFLLHLFILLGFWAGHAHHVTPGRGAEIQTAWLAMWDLILLTTGRWSSLFKISSFLKVKTVFHTYILAQYPALRSVNTW